MRRMILPIIKKYWKLLLSAMLVSALGCGIMVGMGGAYLSFDKTLNDYVRDDRYPSAIITTDIINRNRLDAVKQIEGVTAAYSRACSDTIMIDPSGRYLSVRVFSYSEDDIEKFHIWSSGDCGERECVMLEYNFAEDNGIKAGDEVLFKIGDEYRSYLVEATVTAPETLSVQVTDDSWGVNPDFGFAYFSVELLEKETEKEREAAREELEERDSELAEAEQNANQSFEDAKQQLDDIKAMLEENEANLVQARSEAEARKKELADAKKQLLNTRRELVQSISELERTQAQLTAAKPQVTQGIERLEQARSALAQIDRQLAELNASYAELTAPDVVAGIDLLRDLPTNTPLSAIFEAHQRLMGFLQLAAQYGFEYDENMPLSSVAADLDAFIVTVEEDYIYLNSEPVLYLIDRAMLGEDISQEPEYPHLVEVINRYDDTLENGGDIVDAYNNALNNVTYLHNQIRDNRVEEAIMLMSIYGGDLTIREINDRISQLSRLVSELEAATGQQITTVGQLIYAYNTTKSRLESSIAELERQRAEIVSALEQQGVHENEIDQKLAELRSQLAEINSGLASIPGAIAQCRDGIAQVDSGVSDIEAAVAEINRQLAEAEQQFDDAVTEYERGKSEYDSSLADAMSEFADLHEELRKAYAELDESEGYESLANQFMLYFDPSLDQHALLSAAEKALGDDVTIKKSFVYENSGVKKRIEVNMAPIETMSTFMPMIFFIVVLIVVFLFMSLIIRQCRREIGILRALGFEKGEIRLLYCGVDLIVSLLSIVIGVGIGYTVMRYVCGYFRDFFPLRSFQFLLDPKSVALSAVLTIVVGQAATLIGTTLISKISPSEAMTRPAPQTAKVPRLLAALTKKSKPMVKFSVSSMLRNKGRFLFSVVCVAASVMMIFSSFSFVTSKNHILTELYDERIHYDCQVFFNGQPGDEVREELEALPFVSLVQMLEYYERDIEYNGRIAPAVINALEPGTELISVYGPGSEPLPLPTDGIIIERHLAEQLGVRQGDTVLVDGEELRVESISEQSVSRFQYISSETCSRLKEASLGCLIINVDEADEQKLLEKLTSTEDYLYSVFTHLSHEGNAKVFRTYDLSAMIIIAFAILIGLTIVYNTTQTNLLERKKELCVLRTLGFQRSSISGSWFVQSLLQFVCSCLVGFPLGVVVARTALQKVSTEGREYVFANGPKEYLLTVLIVFAYIVISHILAMNALKHWDIVEAVKEKE